jgi:sugar O-acyltransferase (sialic acid O-acetyltransferase NeuD family)
VSRLIIVGAGGHGAELYAYAQDLVRLGLLQECLGFLDDAIDCATGLAPILGNLAAFERCPDEFFDGLRYVVAVGANPTRRRLVDEVQGRYGARLTAATLLHPSSYVGAQVDIGSGSCLAPGAIVTCRTRIGGHCILNVKASVSHDCVVGDFVNLNPAATVCGNVTIGDGAYIGAGAIIKDKVSIGAGSIVGAGSTVIADVPANVTVVGVPARIIKQHPVTV